MADVTTRRRRGPWLVLWLAGDKGLRGMILSRVHLSIQLHSTLLHSACHRNYISDVHCSSSS